MFDQIASGEIDEGSLPTAELCNATLVLKEVLEAVKELSADPANINDYYKPQDVKDTLDSMMNGLEMISGRQAEEVLKKVIEIIRYLSCVLKDIRAIEEYSSTIVSRLEHSYTEIKEMLDGLIKEIKEDKPRINLILKNLREKEDIEGEIRRYQSNMDEANQDKKDRENATCEDKTNSISINLLDEIKKLSVSGFLRLTLDCQQEDDDDARKQEKTPYLNANLHKITSCLVRTPSDPEKEGILQAYQNLTANTNTSIAWFVFWPVVKLFNVVVSWWKRKKAKAFLEETAERMHSREAYQTTAKIKKKLKKQRPIMTEDKPAGSITCHSSTASKITTLHHFLNDKNNTSKFEGYVNGFAEDSNASQAKLTREKQTPVFTSLSSLLHPRSRGSLRSPSAQSLRKQR